MFFDYLHVWGWHKKLGEIFLQYILVIISNDEDDERQYIQFQANLFLWPYSTFVVIYMARILDFNFTKLQWNCIG